jgi:hypothetical protein
MGRERDSVRRKDIIIYETIIYEINIIINVCWILPISKIK